MTSRFVAEYQSLDGRYQARIWYSFRGQLILTTLDLNGPRARCYFPKTEAQAHRWARRLANVA